VDAIGFSEPPRHIEFARLNHNYCNTSKRKNMRLGTEKLVTCWDDPRMATLCGMRRRGYPAAAIRDFIERVGVSKAHSVVDYGLLEACVRDDLNLNAERAMAVLEPLKVIIENYPEGKSEKLEVEIHPDKPELGTRSVTFSREIYVEKSDFMAEPVKKYFRLFPGNEVRLKGAYFITCTGYETDADGNVTLLRCTYDPLTKGGNAPDGRKVKGTIHWVDACDNIRIEARLYDRLFNAEDPASLEDAEFDAAINPGSLTVLDNCIMDAGYRDIKPGDTFQFMRQGYFCADPDSTPGHPVFNRTVQLNSSWGK
ncbi:MAG: glutamine--tRNA ligase, partial [Clostridiales bacterium]|nr:glutamine--tRNA ligase [Clostridiales bacterium]